MDTEYKICSQCVMDTTAKEITFDENGVCNFCHQAEQALAEIATEKLVVGNPYIRPYNCLIGLSGGVDSSYMLYLAVAFGWKPLAFTVDTGYNKAEADENILRLVEKFKVPLYRHVIDLEKFKELQSTFIKAGVRNIEIPTDHVLMAVSLKLAEENNIRVILSGGNVATESIMPPSWGYNARDLTHIKAIYKKFAKKTLTGLPMCGILKWNYYRWIRNIKTVYLLDTVAYHRKTAEEFLIKNFGFKSTGEKHEENYFTWWFQNFYLFTKFGIDKRKAHYSSMINSGQMNRKDAMNMLTASPIYPELGIEKLAMKYPKHEHTDYPMDKWYGRIAKVMKYVGA